MARSYAASWGLTVRGATLVKRHRHSWYFGMAAHEFELGTEKGTARVLVSSDGVSSFDLRPSGSDTPMLPPWAAFPHFTSVTIFWRMVPGEGYLARWDGYYAGLSEVDRAAYRESYPAPTDEERGWAGFYVIVDTYPPSPSDFKRTPREPEADGVG